jgi:cell division protein FtsA
MDTRIGYPNEHLAGNSAEELSSPLYATAVGLVMNSLHNNTRSASPAYHIDIKKEEEPRLQVQQPIAVEPEPMEFEVEAPVQAQPTPVAKEAPSEKRVRKNFFDKYIEKIKDFLENAE